ncbi:MAG: hypothetical protein HRU50_08560 [Winogradskyella sp.]|uniref:hypothetical protein n=1 Tax=Winogradskyella sp. TaxID=1883156 RepID=UPI0025E5CEBD|nr:hypothetical protein [Winogradskyella sp.]NRB59968.1 hypothetical protein [Winogradskyella sp.]
MERQEFTYLLQHPEAVSVSQTDKLAYLVKEYPYFQPARALLLKGLKLKESYKYNNALKTTAAHTTDRSVLFDYITTTDFNQNEISLQIKQNFENIKNIEVHNIDDISVDKSVMIDDALKQHIKETEGVLDPNLFEVKADESSNTTIAEETIIDIDVENITPEEKLNIGKPLEFDKTESHSFSEWLKITSFQPIKRDVLLEEEEDTSEEKTASPLESKLAIIDKFIDENPKIKPVKKDAPKLKLVNNDDDVSESLMTETLARIYLEQKNYDKAIQSYKILSLKYPEKNSFFADQIKLVQDLKENNTI